MADTEAERLLILLEVAANHALDNCSPEAYREVEITVLDVMDYFDREIQARFLEVKAEREAQRKYLKKKNETQMQ